MNRFDSIEDIYPLTPLQKGLLIHALEAPDSDVYVEQFSCELNGDVDVDAFRSCLSALLQRHRVLRTAFNWENVEEPVQIVFREPKLNFLVADKSAESGFSFETFLAENLANGFVLNRIPLIRFALIRVSDSKWQFVWTHHHILMDGWCRPMLFREFVQSYVASKQHVPVAVPPRRPFSDYIAWLKKQDAQKAESFWRKYLSRATYPSIVPFQIGEDRASGRDKHDEITRTISKSATEKISGLAKQEKLTFNTIFSGAYAVLLARCTQERSVLFGTIVSGRPADFEGVSDVIGLFINAVPLRADLPPEMSCAKWLFELQSSLAEAREFEWSPLVKIKNWSPLPRLSPLFESLLVFENYPVSAMADVPRSTGLSIDNVRVHERTHYPLTLIIVPGESVSLKLIYDSSRYQAAQMQSFLDAYLHVLDCLSGRPESALAEIETTAMNAFGADSEAGDQVKVRGLRFELSRWEALLVQCPGVAEGALLVQKGGSGHDELIALVVTDGRGSFEPDAAMRFLRSRLPDYLVPGTVEVVENIPRGVEGRINREALLSLAKSRPPADPNSAITDLEQEIAAIWCEVLGVSHVSMTSNFFDAGGDSLQTLPVLRRIRRLRQLQGRSLSVVELFRYPTIRGLATFLAAQASAGPEPDKPQATSVMEPQHRASRRQVRTTQSV